MKEKYLFLPPKPKFTNKIIDKKELGLPRGNIFHSDLEFPWKQDGDSRKWGVETNSERIFLAGAGALRGGGVSGIAGHNAAMAALET